MIKSRILMLCTFFCLSQLNLRAASFGLESDTLIYGVAIPMDSVGNGQPPFTITEPGSYYFTKDIILNTGSNNDGIRVDASHVIIDLNGHRLLPDGNINSDDGIVILGEESDITIKNGTVQGWGGDGIYGFSASECRFENLTVKNNGGEGIYARFNCLVKNCQTINNGGNGVFVDDGSVVVDCVSSGNETDGIDTDESCTIIRCKSYGNKFDGFDIGPYCRVENSHAHQNERHGFDMALGSNAFDCVSQKNGQNGFDLASANMLVRAKASGNGFCINDINCDTQPSGSSTSSLGSYGNGVRAFANNRIIDSEFSDNERAGIRLSSQDCYVANNACLNNKNVGIYVEVLGNLIVKNVGHSNGVNPDQDYTDNGTLIQGNFSIDSGTSFGPIVNFNGVGDVSTITNSDHPFANFEY